VSWGTPTGRRNRYQIHYNNNSQSQGDFMPTHKAEAEWKGTLARGSGHLKVGSGAFDGPYSFKSRFEEGQSATNPEELIGAAHAGCFTMALTAQLSRAGVTPTRIFTTAKVHLEKTGDAFAITRIELDTEAKIPGIDDGTFQRLALDAKQNCPVSKALAGTAIQLNARLL
jgi:osmotically inducible protein OsmC